MSGRSTPVGTLRLRAGARGHRRLGLLVLALLSLALVAHHVVPDHAMPSAAGHGEHAMSAPSTCAAVVEGALVLAPVSGVVRLCQRRRGRHAAIATTRLKWLAVTPPTPPPRAGAPLFLRIAVLRR